MAYQVRDEQVNEALKYLNVREAVLGGYDTKEVTFYPQDTPDEPLKALAYVATPQNPGYLGPAPEEAHSALFWSSCSVGRGAKLFNVHKTEAKAGPSQVGEENVSG